MEVILSLTTSILLITTSILLITTFIDSFSFETDYGFELAGFDVTLSKFFNTSDCFQLNRSSLNETSVKFTIIKNDCDVYEIVFFSAVTGDNIKQLGDWWIMKITTADFILEFEEQVTSSNVGLFIKGLKHGMSKIANVE